ncbi:GNAT family N-acetyltransferase [Roseobacter sp.]|uniref:GNAT family N-acetyltransferase n=1 Tax=Roseobacter sp. TaxID=1907202 RepID=UPI0029667C16|nr:GNAT family N-acetyltransferase [Roseobacter sp.]MDW3184055.1 GNAT family N-acetyltransferase [Roseobacter sp.]
MRLRDGTLADVPEISAFLVELTALGKRTRPDDEAFVRSNYIENAAKVSCTVAEDDAGHVLGFQVLTVAAAGNEWGTDPGWGIIGTHVRPNAARTGVGHALFTATREAAQKAGLQKIEATIGAKSAEALGYYEAMGFRTYRQYDDRICKCFDVAGAPRD